MVLETSCRTLPFEQLADSARNLGRDEGGENVLQLAAAESRGAETLKSLGVQTIAEARKLPAQAVSPAGGGILDRFWPILSGFLTVSYRHFPVN
jgi:hypothetical protein